MQLLSTDNTKQQIKLCKYLFSVTTHRTNRMEMFYATAHSTHFIYGYMASDTELIDEVCYYMMCYPFTTHYISRPGQSNLCP